MKYVETLISFLFIHRVCGHFLTTCSTPTNKIVKEGLNKSEEISAPIFYHDVESILKVLNEPQNKCVTDVRELLQFYCEAKKRRDRLNNNSLININKHPLIVIEGLSGSGKTTLARYLVQKLNATKFHSPPAYVERFKHNFQNSFTLSTAFNFLSQYIASFDVQTLLPYSSVIMDRYWYSSLAFSIAYAVNNYPEKYSMPPKGSPVYSWPSDLLRPDIVILLDVDEKVRRERLNKRNDLIRGVINNNYIDDFMIQCPGFLDNLLNVYKNANNPKVVVINATASSDEVSEQVYSKIRELVEI